MTIAVHGSYFGYNFGDTLLCQIFCEMVKEARPEEEIVLPRANRLNTQLIGADKRGLVEFMRARALIFTGGGYFGEPSEASIAWSARAAARHLVVAELARKRNMPVALFGVGVGPISNDILRERIRRLFDSAHTVVVRDVESQDYLHKIGVSRSIAIHRDAAIGYDDAKHSREGGPRRVLVHGNAQPSDREYSVLREAINWLASHPDVEVVLASDGLPRRKAILWPDRLQSEFPHLNMPYVPYSGNPADLLKLIDGVDFVLTTKLHVGIVSLSKGKYVVSVPTHHKTKRLYRQIDLAEHCLPLDSFDPQWLRNHFDQWRSGAKPDLTTISRLAAANPYPELIASFLRDAEIVNAERGAGAAR